MRYSTRLTLVLLMMLYIGPMIFISSYGHTATPAEPNIVKDFSLADGESWLDGRGFRREVTISGIGGAAGTNYQMLLNVTYDSDMQSDFDDILFTDDNGETLLDHWRETYTASTFALFWVEVADNLDTGGNIYMYYGNSTATDASNGTATFIFYEDWTVESVDPAKWTTVFSDGSISFDDTDANHGSVIKLEGTAGIDVYELRTVLFQTSPQSIIGRVKLENTVAVSQRTVWGSGSQSAYSLALIRSVDGTEQFLALDDDSNADDDPLGAGYFDSYHNYMITRDGTSAKMYDDYALISTLSCEPDVNSRNAIMLYVRDSEYDLYMDWSAVRKFVADEPVATIGEEEREFPLEWNEVGEATLYFVVSFDMWGYNSGLIILGLVMIPVSMLYLAYGIKHDRSSNRLFYGLIIFFLGCGLFIGGILP